MNSFAQFAWQFAAIVWLRWRLSMNRLQRGGVLNAVLLAIGSAMVVLFAIGLFAGSILVGWLALGAAPGWVVLLTWDGVALAFLFVWMVGLLTELQRSEPLSLDRFLHLPVSPSGAFVINYLSSLVNVTLILFLSATLGLTIGLALSRGLWTLLNLPLLASFLLAVTALTYQVQGWLATLMANPRRRRAIVVFGTAALILVTQAPNLIIHSQNWKEPETAAAEFKKNSMDLQHSVDAGEITREEYDRQLGELRQKYAGRPSDPQRWIEFVERFGGIINLVLPPGWLPLGAAGTFDGNPWPALLGTLGLTSIGAASLSRAYRTTVRLYQGAHTAGPAGPATEPAPRDPKPVSTADAKRPLLLERRLPWLSERTTAIALASFVGLARAPEVKMLLLSPLIMAAIFGGVFLSNSALPPVQVRPLFAIGGMAFVLLSMIQLVGNSFGFDRGGFRVYVLSPAPRREVLLGKNLALVPMPLLWGTILLAFLQWRYPMRLDHLLACVPMLASMFLIFCMMANWVALFAPMTIPSGSLKRPSPSMTDFLWHLLLFFGYPVGVMFVLVPLGAEVAMEFLGMMPGVPVCLLGSFALCVALGGLYGLVLDWQGRVLQRREQAILTVVARNEP